MRERREWRERDGMSRGLTRGKPTPNERVEHNKGRKGKGANFLLSAAAFSHHRVDSNVFLRYE